MSGNEDRKTLRKVNESGDVTHGLSLADLFGGGTKKALYDQEKNRLDNLKEYEIVEEYYIADSKLKLEKLELEIAIANDGLNRKSPDANKILRIEEINLERQKLFKKSRNQILDHPFNSVVYKTKNNRLLLVSRMVEDRKAELEQLEAEMAKKATQKEIDDLKKTAKTLNIVVPESILKTKDKTVIQDYIDRQKNNNKNKKSGTVSSGTLNDYNSHGLKIGIKNAGNNGYVNFTIDDVAKFNKLNSGQRKSVITEIAKYANDADLSALEQAIINETNGKSGQISLKVIPSKFSGNNYSNGVVVG